MKIVEKRVLVPAPAPEPTVIVVEKQVLVPAPPTEAKVVVAEKPTVAAEPAPEPKVAAVVKPASAPPPCRPHITLRCRGRDYSHRRHRRARSCQPQPMTAFRARSRCDRARDPSGLLLSYQT